MFGYTSCSLGFKQPPIIPNQVTRQWWELIEGLVFTNQHYLWGGRVSTWCRPNALQYGCRSRAHGTRWMASLRKIDNDTAIILHTTGFLLISFDQQNFLHTQEASLSFTSWWIAPGAHHSPALPGRSIKDPELRPRGVSGFIGVLGGWIVFPCCGYRRQFPSKILRLSHLDILGDGWEHAATFMGNRALLNFCPGGQILTDTDTDPQVQI